MKVILVIANIHNWFADKDFLWWPFAWMRPEKNELMTYQKTTQIAFAFSALISIIFGGFALMQNSFSFLSFIYLLLLTYISFWIWFGFITKPLWNIRAKTFKK